MALLNAQGKEIGRRFSGKPLVVIYCHDTKASGMLAGLQHWDFAQIQTMIESRLGKPVNVYTLDPKRPRPGNMVQSTADIVMDGFSNEFVSNHQSMFDMLVLPDCGGPWANAAAAGETNTILEQIERLLTMVKPGGYVCLNKFMSVSIDTLQSYFQQKGFSVEQSPSSAETPYLVIQRPRANEGGRRKTVRKRTRRLKTRHRRRRT